jgi:hypothetical protein
MSAMGDHQFATHHSEQNLITANGYYHDTQCLIITPNPTNYIMNHVIACRGALKKVRGCRMKSNKFSAHTLYVIDTFGRSMTFYDTANALLTFFDCVKIGCVTLVHS